MAVIKAISSKSPVAGVIKYILQKEKTEWKISGGFNCTPETAKEEMELTKELWHKPGGRTYFHFIQSFAPGEEITPETAHELARKFVEQLDLFKGFEVVYATHKDRKHIHTHYAVNSVNAEDGHKLRMRKKDLQAMKDFSDSLCRKYGLTVTAKGKSFQDTAREDTTAYRKNTYQLLQKAEKKKAESYVTDIALAVMDARETAVSRDDFINKMDQAGYQVNWIDTRKYIVFEDKKRKKKSEKKYKIRNKKLEEYFHIDFGKEQLEYEFENNARRAERDQDKPASYEWIRSTDEFFDFGIGENGTDVVSGEIDSGEYSSEGSIGQVSRQLRDLAEGIERGTGKDQDALCGSEKCSQGSEDRKHDSGRRNRQKASVL